MTEEKFNPDEWQPEVSSGYEGFRNTKTSQWIYLNDFNEQSRIYELGKCDTPDKAWAAMEKGSLCDAMRILTNPDNGLTLEEMTIFSFEHSDNKIIRFKMQRKTGGIQHIEYSLIHTSTMPSRYGPDNSTEHCTCVQSIDNSKPHCAKQCSKECGGVKYSELMGVIDSSKIRHIGMVYYD
jgi:hypothetical protein